MTCPGSRSSTRVPGWRVVTLAGFEVVSAAAGFAVESAGDGGGAWAFEAPGERTESDASAAVKAATRRIFATIWFTRNSFRLDVARSGSTHARVGAPRTVRRGSGGVLRASGTRSHPMPAVRTGWAT